MTIEKPDGKLSDAEATDAGTNTLKFKHNGRDIEIPADKVAGYVARGWDYSTKMEELKKQQSGLEGDRKALDIGRDFTKIAETNPDLAKRIVALANGQGDPASPSLPESIAPALDTENLSDVEKTLLAGQRALEQRLAQRDAELLQMSGDLQTRQQSETQQQISDRIIAEAKATDFWSEQEIKDIVLPEVAAYMATNSGASEAEAVWAKVADHKKMIEGRQARAAEASARGMNFRTQPAGEGTPQVSADEYSKMTAEDLRTGKLGNKIFEALKGVADLPNRL